MVARVKPSSGLIVAFRRLEEPVESIYCHDGHAAWIQSAHLLAKHQPLEVGDSLLVLDGAGDPDMEPELPVPSRASHFS